MSRRTLMALVLVFALVSACGRGEPDTATPAPQPSSAAAAPDSSDGPGPDRPKASGARVQPSESPSVTVPAPPPGTAPAQALTVATRELPLSRGARRPLPTTVWYPTAGQRPFPLIAFSHGLTSEPAAYASILKAWARAGFVVAAPKFPHTRHQADEFDPVDVINQPADITAVITGVLAFGRKEGNLIDGRRIAAAGHSAGGVTTIGLFTGNRDARLSAGVVLAGRQVLRTPFTGTPAPMMFVHGKLDKTVKYADGKAAYDAVPWPKALMSITKGGHVAITKDYRPLIAATTEFLRYALYGDAAARNRIARAATAGGVATFADRLG